ncbi:hypothetical protein FQA47_020467 [Oryzias melastigma]|uniref:Secreted protein n=1 Tax=Oryzias melastigma TaxID=30732 RepID=A0A834CBU7_ORYME|nr:hypothetical protein FQA47_020467 [Oryzias melastigma]
MAAVFLTVFFFPFTFSGGKRSPPAVSVRRPALCLLGLGRRSPPLLGGSAARSQRAAAQISPHGGWGWSAPDSRSARAYGQHGSACHHANRWQM